MVITKAIIDGYKYDTESAKKLYISVLVYPQQNADIKKTYVIYQTKNFAYFFTETINNIKNNTYETRIVPTKKDDIKNFILNEEEYDRYEELFGTVPEACGEDYQSPEQIYDEKLADEINYSLNQCIVPNEEVIPIPQIPNKDTEESLKSSVSFSFVESIKLIWACGINNPVDVKSALENNANPNYKKTLCLEKAIANRNIKIIELLLKYNADPLAKNGKLIKLSFKTHDFEIIKLMCNELNNEELILYGINQCAKIKEAKIICFLSEKLKKEQKNEKK